MFPILTYDHASGGCAIIGGYVVRDPDLPGLAGRYLYRDLCTGDVRSFLARVGPKRVPAFAGMTENNIVGRLWPNGPCKRISVALQAQLKPA